MIGSRFSPEIRQALRIDISATLLFTVFAGLTGPFIGLILRRELGATPLQLAVMSSAGGACLLFSLLWARACHGRPPLPYLVWPGFAARGVFLLVPFVSSAWSSWLPGTSSAPPPRRRKPRSSSACIHGLSAAGPWA